jgi:NADPH2:quinone reductase
MRSVIYAKTGDASVLQVVERPLEEPADGEVRIRVVVSGVNPTDWKTRSGAFGRSAEEPTVPNHDGAGIVDAVTIQLVTQSREAAESIVERLTARD